MVPLKLSIIVTSMVLALVGLYFLFYVYLASKNFKAALGILIIFLPSYFVRFNFGPIPSNLLEVTFGGLFLVWLFKYAKIDWLQVKIFFEEKKVFCYFFLFFLLASIIGIIVAQNWLLALGIWRAYFLEPILLVLILIARRQEIKREDLIWFLAISTVSVSVLAIVQKLTGKFYSPTLDVAELHGRVTSFFTTPNAIGLYIAPILPLMAIGLKDKKKKPAYLAIILLALLAIILSFSEGALLAILLSVIVAIYLLGYKKIATIVVLSGLVLALLSTPLRQNLAFQNQSGQNRVVIWGYTWEHLTKNPDNFILGAGLRSWFDRVQKPVNNFKKIEPLIYPHNIFLNFWSETGLLSMIGFVSIYIYLLCTAWHKYQREKILGVALISSLLIFLIHGLVDVPYFKNDLSFLWWLLAAVILL